MLTITRNIFEAFYITGAVDIEVHILDIQGKQAKLGLKLPKNTYISNTKIHRKKKTKSMEK